MAVPVLGDVADAALATPLRRPVRDVLVAEPDDAGAVAQAEDRLAPPLFEPLDPDALQQRRTTTARVGDELPDGVEVEVDPESGDVHLVRGPHYRGIQFHAESILTEHGYDLIHDLVVELLSATGARPSH